MMNFRIFIFSRRFNIYLYGNTELRENMSGLEDIFQAVRLPLVFVLPLIIIGLLLAFFGRVIFYYLIFIFGGIVIGGGLALIFYATRSDATLVFFGGIGGFIGGGILAILVFRLVLFLIGAFIGFIAAMMLFPDNVYAFGILIGLSGVLFIILFDALLPVATAIQGGSLIGLCLLLSGGELSLSATVALIVAVVGAAFQLFGPVKKMRSRGKAPRHQLWNP
jgi:hypothetical protein